MRLIFWTGMSLVLSLNFSLVWAEKIEPVTLVKSDQNQVLKDARLGLNFRTYPIGAQIAGSFGLSKTFWGNAQTWKYGYARIASNLATSAVINRAGVEAQIYPISILGVSAGYDWALRSFKPPFVSCGDLACLGRVDRAYLRGNLILAYKGLIFQGWVRYEELRPFGMNRPFFDEMTLISGQPSGEKVLTYNPALLYTLRDDLRVGAVSIFVRGLDRGNFSHLYGAALQKQWSPTFSAVFGLGFNKSSLIHHGISGFGMITYTLFPSYAVTDLALRSASESQSQN